MTVALVGAGPGVEAVEAALGDADRSVARVEPDEIDGTRDLAVVVDRAGTRTFQLANERALDAGMPWISVELGGVGGHSLADAAVACFGPDGGCYECLVRRVDATVSDGDDPVSAPGDSDAASEPGDPGSASHSGDPTARLAGALAGNRAVETLAADDPDTPGTVVELPYAERTLLPVPGCDCGGSRDRTLDREHRDRSVDAALDRAERAVDDRLGVVTTVGEAESYPAPYYLARLADTASFADATAPRQAAGVDAGWDAAFMKALGEGLERYCAGVWRRSEFVRGSVDSVGNAVPPSSFVRPDGWASEDGQGDGIDASERPWVPGEALATGDSVHLPAELVQYPPPERRVRPAVTTGLGLGNSTVGALLSGLYEVIERDAATVAWYSTYEPLELAVEDDTYETLAARAGADGLDATALLLTQDIDVPVVAVAVRRESWPKLALGTAAHLDPVRAARKALAEAVQNWVELRGMGAEADSADGAVGRYADQPDAAERFVDHDQRVPAASVGPEDVPAGRAHLDALVERVTDTGPTPYAARTTTRDVAGLGFEAVRVLVPTAQPLFFDEPYFGERARSVPESLGFEPALDRDHHPYP